MSSSTPASTPTGRPLGSPRGEQAGGVAWLLQPLYIVAELAVAAAASDAYRLRDDTISALGSVGCSPALCSSWHPLMNTAFVVFSLLRVAGALLLFRAFSPVRWAAVAVGLWVVSGLFSAGIGFVPVDLYPSAHTLVAIPVFVTQPLAVLATALALRANRGLAASGVVVSLVCFVGAGSFLAVNDGQHWSGFWERVALWPAYPWLAVVGFVLVLSRRSRVASPAASG